MPPRIYLPVRLLVAGALLYTIVTWVTTPTELLSLVATLDPTWLLLAAALTVAGLLLQWWKWRLLVQACLPSIEESDIIRSLFTGFGLGLLTPGRLGELGRGVIWPGVRRKATTLAMADRLVSSLVTLVAGSAYAVYVMPAAWGVWVGVGAIVTGVAWRWFGSLVSARLAAFGVSSLSDVPRSAWLANTVAAALFNAVFCLQMFCLLRAAGSVPSGTLLAIPAMFALKTLLPISFMDLGIREAASVVVLGGVGVAAATAVQASLMLFGLNVLLPGLAGLLLVSLGTHTHDLPTPSQRVEFAHVR
jgi:glycosyltransferase 2 family protein